jgi:hypothetical protein
MTEIEFDPKEAQSRRKELIDEVVRTRNNVTRILNTDVIEYYRNAPDSTSKQDHEEERMRVYVRKAIDELNDLVNGKLR